MTESAAQPSATPQRVVVLGASNVIRCSATWTAVAWQLWGGPLEFCAAMGHGRSYGARTNVLGRGLSGITECNLWERLAASPDVPTQAVVTDVGNDLLYEQPVERILAWVETCLTRLRAAGAATTVTGLPLEGLPKLGKTRFLLLRTLFFPRSRISLATTVARAAELDAGLAALARSSAATFVRPDEHWYGFDPIHVRWPFWTTAWERYLSGGAAAGTMTRSSPPRWVSLHLAPPAERTLLGWRQRRAQPVRTWRDGSSLSAF